MPVWQLDYMDKLNLEYISILNSSKSPYEKFWELEKRIKIDKHKTGVVCDMRRSKMITNIFSLIAEGVITIYDLSEFSDDLISTIQHYLKFNT